MESMKLLRRFLFLGLLLVAAPGVLDAQVAGKKTLDHDAYDIWKSISGTTLSNDGDWIAFVTSIREGDGVMTLRSTQGNNPRVGEVERASGLRMTGVCRCRCGCSTTTVSPTA